MENLEKMFKRVTGQKEPVTENEKVSLRLQIVISIINENPQIDKILKAYYS
jgi:hypothetical protein